MDHDLGTPDQRCVHRPQTLTSDITPLPTRPRFVLAVSTTAAILLLVACSAGASGGNFPATVLPTMPKGAPTHFVPADSTKSMAHADTTVAAPCQSPLKDPQGGVTIILIRSENGVGDYLAPSGSYGIPDGQLLRLECSSGEVLGLVRR